MQIPQYQERVKQEGLPNVRFDPNQPSEAFGGGPSFQALTQATQGALGSIERVAEQEKYQADQVAHIASDSKLSDLQTQIQIDMSNMKGEDALKAHDFVDKQWQQGVEKIRSTLGNQAQANAYERSVGARSNELNKALLVHVNQQTQALDDQTTQSYLDNSLKAAVLNATDDDKVATEADRTAAVLSSKAKRMGISEDSPIFEDMYVKTLSPLHRDVIQERLTQGQNEQAKKYFDENKDEMSPVDVLHTQNAIENEDVITQGNSLFDKMQASHGLKFPDGTYNMEKVRAFVAENSDGLSDKREQKAIEFVAHRAGEFNSNKAKVDQQLDRSFMNEILTKRKNGEPLESAMKTAGRYSTDAYDMSVKSKMVGDIYAPPSQSDAPTFINLWEKGYDGDGSRQAIDQAFKSGKINVGDYRTLVEQDHKAKVDGTDPLTKNAWENVKMQAAAQIGSDKPEYANFMYVMHHDGDGKSPEEIIKMAKDKLKNDPSTGMLGWGWTQSPKYKARARELDANSVGYGTLYEDVGPEQAQAIGASITKQTGKPWTLNQVQEFSQKFGGYSAIKKGTPVNNAVESLRKAGVTINEHNVKQVLSRHKDGLWDGQ